jgi:tRNA(Ile)-lysidine synthase
VGSSDVLHVVRATLRRHAMLAGGERVLIGLSGGADSTALTVVLAALAAEWHLDLRALHVDHRLRADSGRDAEAAQALGRRLGIPVDVVAVEVERRGSLEEAARRARHAALEAHADLVAADRIALGHTADDQAETVLMRALEGCGVRGLAGIPATRGRLIRPLIGLRRPDLVAMLEREAIGWIEDPSNRDPRFLRNRIRHGALPQLAAIHGGDVVAALNRVAAQARDVVATLERQAADELARAATLGGDEITMPRTVLSSLPRGVAAEVLRQAAARLGSRAPLRAWAHRGLGRLLADPPPCHGFRLGAVSLEVSGALLRVARVARVGLPSRGVPVPGAVPLPEAGVVLEARLLDARGYAVPRDPRRVAFDADALASPLLVRARRRGDRFRPFGSSGERRLKAFLADAKVPRWERDSVPVIEAGGEIAWVGGLRRAALAPLTSRSRRVLELALKPLA